MIAATTALAATMIAVRLFRARCASRLRVELVRAEWVSIAGRGKSRGNVGASSVGARDVRLGSGST